MQIGDVNAALLFFLARPGRARRKLSSAPRPEASAAISFPGVSGVTANGPVRAPGNGTASAVLGLQPAAAPGAAFNGSRQRKVPSALTGNPSPQAGQGKRPWPHNQPFYAARSGRGRRKDGVSPRERGAKRDGPGEERLRLQRPRTGSRQTVTSDNVCGSRERDRPTLGVAFPNSPG